MFTLLVSQSLHDTKAILTAFFNVNLNHMLLHSEFHVFISLAWKSLNLQYCYTLFIILCQHLFDNLDTFFLFMAESVRFELTEPFRLYFGGSGRIRTHGTLSRSSAFKADAIDQTLPHFQIILLLLLY